MTRHETQDDTDSDSAESWVCGASSGKEFSRKRCLLHPVLAAKPKECQTYAKLELWVVQAAELSKFANELADTMDPYVRVFVDDVAVVDDDKKFEQTPVLYNTCAPIWKHKFSDIPIPTPDSILTLRLLDKDIVTEDSKVGFLDIRVGALPLNRLVEDWFPVYACNPDQDADSIKRRLMQCTTLQSPKYTGWIKLKLKMNVKRELDVLFAHMLYPPVHGHGLQRLRLEQMWEVAVDLAKKQRRIKAEIAPVIEFIWSYPTILSCLTILSLWIPQMWTPYCLVCVGVTGYYLDVTSRPAEAIENAAVPLASRRRALIPSFLRKATPQKRQKDKTDELGIRTAALATLNTLMPRAVSIPLRRTAATLEIMAKIYGYVLSRVKHAFRTVSLPLMIAILAIYFGWPYIFLAGKVAASFALVYCTVVGRVLKAFWKYHHFKQIQLPPDSSGHLQARKSMVAHTHADLSSSHGIHLGNDLMAPLLVSSNQARMDFKKMQPHSPQPLTFYSMTWCHICAGPVVGVFGQGSECSACKMIICKNHKCTKLVDELKDCKGTEQPSPYYLDPRAASKVCNKVSFNCRDPSLYCDSPRIGTSEMV